MNKIEHILVHVSHKRGQLLRCMLEARIDESALGTQCELSQVRWNRSTALEVFLYLAPKLSDVNLRSVKTKNETMSQTKTNKVLVVAANALHTAFGPWDRRKRHGKAQLFQALSPHANAHLSSILSTMNTCVVCVSYDVPCSYPSVKIVQLLSFLFEARERRIPWIAARSWSTDIAVYIMRGHTMSISLKSILLCKI